MKIIHCNKKFLFFFGFGKAKDVDKNLKHEIEFVFNSNESFAENERDKTNNYC